MQIPVLTATPRGTGGSNTEQNPRTASEAGEAVEVPFARILEDQQIPGGAMETGGSGTSKDLLPAELADPKPPLEDETMQPAAWKEPVSGPSPDRSDRYGGIGLPLQTPSAPIAGRTTPDRQAFDASFADNQNLAVSSRNSSTVQPAMGLDLEIDGPLERQIWASGRSITAREGSPRSGFPSENRAVILSGDSDPMLPRAVSSTELPPENRMGQGVALAAAPHTRTAHAPIAGGKTIKTATGYRFGLPNGSMPLGNGLRSSPLPSDQILEGRDANVTSPIKSTSDHPLSLPEAAVGNPHERKSFRSPLDPEVNWGVRAEPKWDTQTWEPDVRTTHGGAERIASVPSNRLAVSAKVSGEAQGHSVIAPSAAELHVRMKNEEASGRPEKSSSPEMHPARADTSIQVRHGPARTFDPSLPEPRMATGGANHTPDAHKREATVPTGLYSTPYAMSSRQSNSIASRHPEGVVPTARGEDGAATRAQVSSLSPDIRIDSRPPEAMGKASTPVGGAPNGVEPATHVPISESVIAGPLDDAPRTEGRPGSGGVQYAEPVNRTIPTPAQQLGEAMRHTPPPGNGSGTLEVALHPEELGRVRLTFTNAEAGLTVSVQAERGETLEMLRRHIDLLREDLREHGFDGVDFAFSDQSDQRAGSGGPDDGSREHPTPSLNPLVADTGAEAAMLRDPRILDDATSGIDLRL